MAKKHRRSGRDPGRALGATPGRSGGQGQDKCWQQLYFYRNPHDRAF